MTPSPKRGSGSQVSVRRVSTPLSTNELDNCGPVAELAQVTLKCHFVNCCRGRTSRGGAT